MCAREHACRARAHVRCARAHAREHGMLCFVVFGSCLRPGLCRALRPVAYLMGVSLSVRTHCFACASLRVVLTWYLDCASPGLHRWHAASCSCCTACWLTCSALTPAQQQLVHSRLCRCALGAQPEAGCCEFDSVQTCCAVTWDPMRFGVPSLFPVCQ